jgi:hypothetical protein
MTWMDCFGALSIVWGFLVALLLTDWLYSIYTQWKG